MFSRIWKKIKGFAGSIKEFIAKHFHKAAAVTTSGLTIITLEVIGFLALDSLLLASSMTSLIGLIALCFGYFMVMFGAITVGLSLFDYMWENAHPANIWSTLRSIPKSIKEFIMGEEIKYHKSNNTDPIIEGATA